MTFKPGALVMLTNATEPLLKQFVGTPRVLGGRGVLFPTNWRFDPPLVVAGHVVVWPEHMMRLIDPGTGTDEMIIRCGLPHGETV